jgi:hypothetical protein
MPCVPIIPCLLAALVVIAMGCQSDDPTSDTEIVADSVSVQESESTIERLLTGKVWIRADSTGRPGVMQVFLPDGTLLMDSCWETFRLEKWRALSADRLVWQEDTEEITAVIVDLSDSVLQLRLELRADTLEQSFRVADVPYLCPDMPQ